MKKKVGKIKRFIAMLMVGITLSSSVFYSYSLPAQATAILPAVEAVTEALMTIFGYSLGLGKSVSSVSDSMDSSLLNSIYSGSAIDVGSYGTVDFSNGASIYDFLTFTQDFMSSHILGSYYHNYFARMDYLSYKNSGTSASKAMLEGMQTLINDIDVELSAQPDADEEHRAALIREFMVTSIVPLLSPGGNGDDDDPHSTSKAWRAIAGLLAAFTAVSSIPVLEDGTEDEDALAVPEDSEYTEYSNEDLVKNLNDYFSDYNYDSDGNYLCNFVCSDGQICSVWSEDEFAGFWSAKSNGSEYLYIYGLSEVYYRFSGSSSSVVISPKSSTSVVKKNLIVSNNLPMFASQAEAYSFVMYGDKTFLLNGLDTETIFIFYETTPTCTVPEYVVNFMTKTPSTTDITGLATALENIPTDIAGTAEYIPAVESVVQTATDALPESSVNPDEVPEESVEQEQDPETGQFNYFNILQLILNAIKAIAESVWKFFENPMAGILTGINNLIELLPNCFELVRGWIELLPSSIFLLFESPLLTIQKTLAGLNPSESWWPKLQPYLDKFLDLFQASVPEADLTVPDIPTEDDGGNGKHSFDLLSLLNGLWLLIMILIMLLSIFLHLMIFIINIFKIPATTGYLNENMVMGLNYIKTLEITGIGLSVYDFMMGLVYILMVFGVVKVLRANIHHIKIPKSMRGGLFK